MATPISLTPQPGRTSGALVLNINAPLSNYAGDGAPGAAGGLAGAGTGVDSFQRKPNTPFTPNPFGQPEQQLQEAYNYAEQARNSYLNLANQMNGQAFQNKIAPQPFAPQAQQPFGQFNGAQGANPFQPQQQAQQFQQQLQQLQQMQQAQQAQQAAQQQQFQQPAPPAQQPAQQAQGFDPAQQMQQFQQPAPPAQQPAQQPFDPVQNMQQQLQQQQPQGYPQQQQQPGFQQQQPQPGYMDPAMQQQMMQQQGYMDPAMQQQMMQQQGYMDPAMQQQMMQQQGYMDPAMQQQMMQQQQAGSPLAFASLNDINTMLAQPDPQQKLAAINELAGRQQGDLQSYELLKQSVLNPTPGVTPDVDAQLRQAALYALGNMNAAQNAQLQTAEMPGMDAINKILGNNAENPAVKMAAVGALGALNRPQDPIVQRLLAKAEKDANPDVKAAVAQIKAAAQMMPQQQPQPAMR